jgi:hypothetical protein
MVWWTLSRFSKNKSISFKRFRKLNDRGQASGSIGGIGRAPRDHA